MDESPLRLRIEPQTPVRNRDGTVWASDYQVEVYFHPEHWYNVFLLRKSTGVEWYCNVASPPRFDSGKGEVYFVDYDLDVYVYADGNYKVLDREEFEENAQTMNYPPEIREKAEQALQALIVAVKERRAPFSPGV